MKSVILYTSSHGTTEKAANLLKDKLKGDTELINLKKNKNPDISGYDLVIIGTSIHAGNIPSSVKQYIRRNQEKMLSKKTGLFLCCMREGEEARNQFENAFPEVLRKKSVASGLFGGEFLFGKMNFLQRAIVRKVSGAEKDVSKINNDAINDFAKKLNRSK
jgi:menaquinone-dependent protoporphyrinogen oxidase